MKVITFVRCLMFTAHLSLMAMQDPLLQAITDNNLDELKEVLADKNPNYYNAHAGVTPLGFACQKGNSHVVKALLDAGAEIDFQLTDKTSNPLHPTALTSTALAGNYQICEMLLSKGANPNPRNPDNFTPLHAAARNGSATIVQLLLDNGANINAQTDLYNSTPLHEVIPQIADQGTPKEIGNYQACLRLLKAGANPDMQTKYIYAGNHPEAVLDKTPLMLAAERGKRIYVHLLILYHADMTITDRRGRPTYVLAELRSHYKLAKLLYY